MYVLGVAYLRKTPISCVIYVRPSVSWYVCPNISIRLLLIDLNEIWYWRLSLKSIVNLEIWLQSYKNIAHCK